MEKYRREMKLNPLAEYPWLMMLSAVDYRKKTIDKGIFNELEEFALNEQEVREALVEWETLSANRENKVLYEARLKYLRDQLSNIMGERRAGREEGIKEGIRSMAKKLLEDGMPIAKIRELTGLSEEAIKSL